MQREGPGRRTWPIICPVTDMPGTPPPPGPLPPPGSPTPPGAQPPPPPGSETPPAAPQAPPPEAVQPVPPPVAPPSAEAALASKGWACPVCGGHLSWNPTKVMLDCRACENTIAVSDTGGVAKHSFSAGSPPSSSPGQDSKHTCRSCGAESTIVAADLAGACHYCEAPWVATSMHNPVPRPDGVVPASIDITVAKAAVQKWVTSRRFAPNDFKTGAQQPTISLAYHPLWAFDTESSSQYTGERGTHRQETRSRTASDGSQQTYQETVTDWSSTSGFVQHSFTDMGIPGDPSGVKRSEWDLSASRGYSDAYLVGATAQGATVPLPDAWGTAENIMESAIRDDVRQDIGGDEQRIDSLNIDYSDSTVRYLLAPSWSGAYTYKTKQYTIDINAETGTVTGKRPYSAIKIGLTIFAILVLITGIVLFAVSQHNKSNTQPTNVTSPTFDPNPTVDPFATDDPFAGPTDTGSLMRPVAAVHGAVTVVPQDSDGLHQLPAIAVGKN